MLTRFLMTAATAGLLVACSQAQTDLKLPEESSGDNKISLPSMMNAKASIIGVEGTEIGTANLIEGPNGLLLRIALEPGAMTPGWHGLHLHAKGDCSDVGVFKASTGHVGKVEGGHGLLNPAGPEGGDIPNIWVAADGSAGYEAYTTLTTGASLMDEDGSAIIIHENEDDHLTQPIGGAGARVACGALK